VVLFVIIKRDTMKKTLKKNYEFKKVLNRGKFSSGKYIEVFYLENNKKTNFIGIAISSKAANATERNRIKRLIRENYKSEEKNIKKGFNIVFLWNKRQNTENCNFYEMQEDIKKIFKNIGFYIDS